MRIMYIILCTSGWVWTAFALMYVAIASKSSRIEMLERKLREKKSD